jgi:hypothetical protein
MAFCLPDLSTHVLIIMILFVIFKKTMFNNIFNLTWGLYG